MIYRVITDFDEPCCGTVMCFETEGQAKKYAESQYELPDAIHVKVTKMEDIVDLWKYRYRHTSDVKVGI